MKLSIFDNNFNNPESVEYPFEKRAEVIKSFGIDGVHWSYPDFENQYLQLFFQP